MYYSMIFVFFYLYTPLPSSCMVVFDCVIIMKYYHRFLIYTRHAYACTWVSTCSYRIILILKMCGAAVRMSNIWYANITHTHP